jgi:hypothetical protein
MGAISKKLKVGRSTVCDIIKRYKESSPDSYEQIRTDSRIAMIDKAKGLADQILDLVEKKVKLTTSCEEALLSVKLNELTSAFGVIFDRLEVMQNRSDEVDGGGVIEIVKTEPLTPPSDDEEGDADE